MRYYNRNGLLYDLHFASYFPPTSPHYLHYSERRMDWKYELLFEPLSLDLCTIFESVAFTLTRLGGGI